MKKWQVENSETSDISEILFRVFLFPYSQNRKLGFKNLKKEFSRFPSFRLGP